MDVIDAISRSIYKLAKEYKRVNDKKKGRVNHVMFGRSPTQSDIFEENLAKNLAKVYTKKDYYFLIDYPISFAPPIPSKLNGKGQQARYPDIVVLKGKPSPHKDKTKAELIGIIDLKIDIGPLNVDGNERSIRKLRDHLKVAKIGKFNSIPGAADKEAHKHNKKLYFKISNPSTIKKIALVTTKDNDRKEKDGQYRSEKYEKSMKKHGYHVIFLLDDDQTPRGNHKEFVDKGVRYIAPLIRKRSAEIQRAFKGL